jgi:hypothetical protein
MVRGSGIPVNGFSDLEGVSVQEKRVVTKWKKAANRKLNFDV